MNVYLETMGCQMNRLDSELAISALRAAGHAMTDDVRAADVLLYNTCSVRRHAEMKVYSRLGQAAQRKQARPELVIGVLGCMAQKEGQELRRTHPCVDIVCSPGRLAELPELIRLALAGSPSVAVAERRALGTRHLGLGNGKQQGLGTRDLGLGNGERQGLGTGHLAPGNGESSNGKNSGCGNDNSNNGVGESAWDDLDLSRDPAMTASPMQAYVRVVQGCDKFCSYCIVPFVRGPESCRDPANIVREVARLVDAGRSEITLLGQTVNSYRWPGGGQAVSFADLLARVSAVAGLRRLRFVTSHPIDFGDDVLMAMRDLPNVCPYIHAPAQSGSDAILKKMNRHYTRGQYDDLVDRARAIVPGVVLAGDFIVGFPTETDADHAASAELIRRSAYKNSFIFKYSPREGTAAARNLKDDVPNDVKKRRNNELLAVQDEVGLAHHRAMIGSIQEVLVEGPSPRSIKMGTAGIQLVGRTRGDHIVVFDAPPHLAGQYVNVRIVDASSLTLFGVI